MGYSTIEHRCNASRRVVKVTIVGFLLACLTMLEGIVCSFAYAESQTVDTANTLQMITVDSSEDIVDSSEDISDQPLPVTIAYNPVIQPAYSAPLSEGAVPQTRFFVPLSVSPSTIAKKTGYGQTRPGETIADKTRGKDTELENIAAMATAVPEVGGDAFTEESLPLDALPSTTTATSEVIPSPINNAAFPEGAVPTTKIFYPQPSPQPLGRTGPAKDNGATDQITAEVGVTEADLGPLRPNNGATIFRIANENTALPIPPSEVLQPQDVVPIEPESEPELEPFELPPIDDLLEPLETPIPPPLPTDNVKFDISQFDFTGNTAFDNATLTTLTNEFRGEQKTFADVAAAREAVTQLYIENGYATSGAIVPPQSVTDEVIEIEIIEGSLGDIVVQGNRRLRSGYISSRIGLSTAAPLNVDHLIERLQLLQTDPLIKTISADLQASPEPGQNILVVAVVEDDSFEAAYELDNNRSPSVGTVRNQLRVSEGNLLGFGDRLAMSYTLTGGSDGIGIDYTVPVSPYETTLGVSINLSDSEVIEDPFDVLEIDSDSESYELTLRQPLRRSPTQELAIGLTASHQRTQTALGIDDIGPFPLAPGADDDGQTRVSALRFFQEWTHRSPSQVLALRSQFNMGIDALGATINDDAPDSQFFSWQGQGQWLKLLATDTPLVLKGSAQLTPNSLLSLEQLSLGGQSTVRGYRQNFLSTDNGVSASAEVRFPVARERSSNLLLQVAPFLDAGYGWNNGGESPDPIVGAGVGLVFQWEKSLFARLDWGIPIINAADNRDSLQENGVYFSLRYSFL